MTPAVVGGDKELFGWDIDRWILAAIFDAIGVNTVATGNWKKGKAPTPPEWPKPKVKQTEQKVTKAMSVKEVHAALQAKRSKG